MCTNQELTLILNNPYLFDQVFILYCLVLCHSFPILPAPSSIHTIYAILSPTLSHHNDRLVIPTDAVHRIMSLVLILTTSALSRKFLSDARMSSFYTNIMFQILPCQLFPLHYTYINSAQMNIKKPYPMHMYL